MRRGCHSSWERKSKYYDVALANFERARRCFEQAGLAAKWQRLVKTVRTEHHSKLRFMAGFEEIVREWTDRNAILPGTGEVAMESRVAA